MGAAAGAIMAIIIVHHMTTASAGRAARAGSAARSPMAGMAGAIACRGSSNAVIRQAAVPRPAPVTT